MKTTFVLLSLLAFCLGMGLTGCDNKSAFSRADTVVQSEAPAQASSDNEIQVPEVALNQATGFAQSQPGASSLIAPMPGRAARQVIYTASMEIRVEDVPEAMNKVRAAVKAAGGYIESEEQNDDNNVSYRLRVPAGELENLMSGVEGIAEHVLSRRMTANDVTTQLVDMDARLKSKREAEAQYLAILRQAQKVEDILKVQEQLRAIREEIEVMDASRRQLSDQVAYSTLNLILSKPGAPTPNPEQGFWYRLGKSISAGWSGLQQFLLLLIALWPLLLIGAAGLFFFLRRRRHVRAKRAVKLAVTVPLAPHVQPEATDSSQAADAGQS